VKERARRRQGELEEKGIREDIAKIESDIRARDKSDEDRKVGPLKAADDAVIVDTTGMSKELVVEKLMEIVEQKYLREK
jgi:cytidylate kinase